MYKKKSWGRRKKTQKPFGRKKSGCRGFEKKKKKKKKRGLFGKKHDDGSSSSSSSDDDADKQKLGADGQKRTHLFGGKKRDADGRKHKKRRGLFGKKHDHDKPKLTDNREHVVADKHPTTVDHTPDMNKVRDGDVVAHGEKVKISMS